MDKKKGWEWFLEMVNKNLTPLGLGIEVKREDGAFSVEIIDGNERECFAENFYEEELGDLINDAWAHARAKRVSYWIVTFVSLSAHDDDANGYSECFLFKTYEEASKKMRSMIESEMEDAIQEFSIYEYTADEFRMGWCAGHEQIRISIHEVKISKSI